MFQQNGTGLEGFVSVWAFNQKCPKSVLNGKHPPRFNSFTAHTWIKCWFISRNLTRWRGDIWTVWISCDETVTHWKLAVHGAGHPWLMQMSVTYMCCGFELLDSWKEEQLHSKWNECYLNESDQLLPRFANYQWSSRCFKMWAAKSEKCAIMNM